ncbi:MAG: hypothetical protein LBH92_08890 [Bacteroidales bacterium]|nr:hypothetical protein [Bacteroidales bacterium]
MKSLFISSIMGEDWSHIKALLTVLVILYSCIFVSVLIDLFFGVKRAKRLKIVRTSFGYRRTITKLTSYFGLLMMLSIADVAASVVLKMPCFTVIGAIGIIIVGYELRGKWPKCRYIGNPSRVCLAKQNHNAMKKFIPVVVLLFFCCACGATKYIPIETVKTEYRDKTIRDSIFQYDSIFVKETADTIFLERYRYLYKDRIIRDSIFINDTIRVPYPVEIIKEAKKPLSGWQYFQIWCGHIALAFGLLTIVYFTLRRKKKRLF